jgi:hypothetical protein
MKHFSKYYLLFILMSFVNKGNSQPQPVPANLNGVIPPVYNSSLSCEKNVNDGSTLSTSVASTNINAVFSWGLYNGPGSLSQPFCTGTLVNQDIDQDNLVSYAFIANHCLDVTNSPSVQYPSNQEYIFYFNYQSKDGNSANIPLDAQTTPRYQLVSQIQVIGKWVDFDLVKILTPIPPHFNVSYAGWKPSFDGGNLFNLPYYGIHHPKGDIKKADQSYVIDYFATPLSVGCTTVVTVIDAVLGFFGIKVTTTICNYVSVPWFVSPFYTSGLTEDGSSGSSMCNINTRLMGTLSGGCGLTYPDLVNCFSSGYGASSCNSILPDAFAKFELGYNLSSIRFALNPHNDLGTNLFGFNSRQISCYHVLQDLHGYYYPAGDYQANNDITLASNTTITTLNSTSAVSPLIIWSGANFTFKAGESITLNPGFNTQSGAVFTGEIASCTANFSPIKSGVTYQSIAQQGPLPQFAFDPQLYLSQSNDSVQVYKIVAYPNPSNGHFKVELSQNINVKSISVVDMYGHKVYENDSPASDELSIDMPSVPPGIYMLKVIDQRGRQYVKKIGVQL